MKIILAIIAVAFITAFGGVFWLRSRVPRPRQTRLDDIPELLKALSAATSRPAFAVFMFPVAAAGDDAGDFVNLQFSLEDGKVGFDWVLLALPNIQDEERFTEFARARGLEPEAKELKQVKYLRVEGGDLAGLCRDVITEMYGRPKDEPLPLLVQGFHWQP